MNARFMDAAELLAERGLLPKACRAVLVAGSIVRGWGNVSSDVDLYVVTDEPWWQEGLERQAIPLGTGYVGVADTMVDDLRWDVRYWSQAQVDELFDKVSWETYRTVDDAGGRLTPAEVMTLERFGYGLAPLGSDWLAAHREKLAASAFRTMLAVHRLNWVDNVTEDAAGQLESGDLPAAVLSAREAFASSMDALLAYHGEPGCNSKWRPRRVQAVAPEAISFDEYWEIETMRRYDPDDPGSWVEEVLGWCRKLTMEISL